MGKGMLKTREVEQTAAAALCGRSLPDREVSRVATYQLQHLGLFRCKIFLKFWHCSIFICI